MLEFIQKLREFIAESRVIDNPVLCYAYGTDASLYRMQPKIVVLVENKYEIEQVLKLAGQYSVALTFRAAGTSLSGQAVTDQVLVVLANTHWQNYAVRDNGRQITLEPGIIGSNANLFLKPYGMKIGPDPASID